MRDPGKTLPSKKGDRLVRRPVGFVNALMGTRTGYMGTVTRFLILLSLVPIAICYLCSERCVVILPFPLQPPPPPSSSSSGNKFFTRPAIFFTTWRYQIRRDLRISHTLCASFFLCFRGSQKLSNHAAPHTHDEAFRFLIDLRLAR